MSIQIQYIPECMYIYIYIYEDESQYFHTTYGHGFLLGNLLGNVLKQQRDAHDHS